MSGGGGTDSGFGANAAGTMGGGGIAAFAPSVCGSGWFIAAAAAAAAATEEHRETPTTTEDRESDGGEGVAALAQASREHTPTAGDVAAAAASWDVLLRASSQALSHQN
mmetsp:Transcript_872/g.3232  ORF Transcript_872/g.3232 Transcript_872/m.3232 type:complete len:109 (-) Transcript_872:1196-1522(-)